MRKTTTSIGSLSFVFAFSLISNFTYAQTAKQITEIQSKSNLTELSTLQSKMKASKPSIETLKKRAEQLNIQFSGESNGRLFQLKELKGLAQLPTYYVTYNTGASAGTGANMLNSSAGVYNLDGQDITIHEWDGGGVLTPHQEFGSRVKQMDKPTQLSDHATHVAGTIVASGVNGAAKGMAPKAALNTYDWTDDELEMVDAAKNGALVSNHSYGFLGGFEYGNWYSPTSTSNNWHWFGSDADTEFIGYGKYAKEDSDWDLIAQNAPFYLPVKAAGNPRGGGPTPGGNHYVRINGAWTLSTKVRQQNCGGTGFDCINFGSTAKNILVVAAAEKLPNGYNSPADVKAASFSAFGPTDDGRIKPDITGIGVNIFSTNTGTNDAYTTMSGTSMASPNVTGSISLLQQHHKNLNNGAFMKSTTLKALIFSTAKEAGNIGPDYKFGWGLLDAQKAALALSTRDKYSLIKENTLNNGASETIEFIAAGGKPIVATISWLDPAPAVLTKGTDLNDRTKMLVNDLDIKIVGEDGTYLPWVLDPATPNNPATKGDNVIDNTEQVVIENPVAGKTYKLIISHKGTLKKNQISNNVVSLVDGTSQDYSVVVTGINNGVEVDLEISTVKVNATKTQYSTQTPVIATIKNIGSQTSAAGKLNFKLVNTDKNIEEQTGVIDLPTINPGESKELTFNVNLSKPFVNYSIQAEVIVDKDDVLINNKLATTAIGTMVDITAKDSSHSFNFESDFASAGWLSEDTDKDGRTWRKYDGAQYANSGNSFAINFPNQKAGTNDWIFTNPLKMKAGSKYRVIFNISKLNSLEEKLDVAYGKDANSTSMTTMIKEGIIATTSYVRHVYSFTPTEDAPYFVGFRNMTAPTVKSYAIFLDDVTVDQSENPIFDYKASKVNPNTFETVTMTSNAYADPVAPVTAYKWEFSPNTITYTNSTSSTSPNPQVIFNNEGKYTVKLTATNSNGSATVTKDNYISALNIATVAEFSADATTVYKGNTVALKDLSTGNPSPTSWKWNITPSEGVTYVGGTTEVSKNPIVQFNNFGKYSVSLTSTSLLNSNTKTKDAFITVNNVNPVRNLKGSGDKANMTANLTWSRPVIDSKYFEGFEGSTQKISASIDEDGDGKNWQMTTFAANVKSGTRAMMSYSWDSTKGAIDVNNWFVTTPIAKGAEQLSFWVKNEYPELYDVYVVKKENVKAAAPTLEEVKAGTKIYDYTSGTERPYENVVVDLKEFNQSDIYLAFHHKSTKAQDGFILLIDDIEVGHNNKVTNKFNPAKSTETHKADELVAGKEYQEKVINQNNTSEDNEIIAPFAAVSPLLTGYQVFRNDVKISDISDANAVSFTETLTENKVHKYDVVAVYGSQTSDKQTVEIDLATLSTLSAKGADRLVVYPNPSEGPFSLKAKEGDKINTIHVYDMSGKLIYSASPKDSKADFDLSKNGKGIYILSVQDDKGSKNSFKLMVK